MGATMTRCIGVVPFSTIADGVWESSPPAMSSSTMCARTAVPISTTMVSAAVASPRQCTSLPGADCPVTMASEDAQWRSVTGMPA